MVLTSVMDPGNFSTSSSKLRRSRRLSSTRGLRSYDTQNPKLPPQRQDLNRGPNTGSMAIEPEARKTMNWELNDRISLSSGSSTGIEIRPDTKKGIGFSDRRKTDEESTDPKNQPRPALTSPQANLKKAPRAASKQALELLNVSGFSPPRKQATSHNSGSTMANGLRERSCTDGNVIKSDSKYEIGVPGGECTMLRKKKKPPRPACNQITMTKPSKTSLKNERNDLTGTANRRRWDMSKDKLDKNNDSITKRLELIHDLNQKILANYERFQQKSKRPYGKSIPEVKSNGSPKSRLRQKDPEDSTKRTVLADLKDSCVNKEHIYSEISLQRKTTKCHTIGKDGPQAPVDQDQKEVPIADAKMSGHEFQPSKDRQSVDQAALSTEDRSGGTQNKSKPTVSRALRNLAGAPLARPTKKTPPGRSNENFSLAARPEFRVDTNIPAGVHGESPIKKLRSKFEGARSSAMRQAPAAFRAQSNRRPRNGDSHRRNLDGDGTNTTPDRLENSRLYPDGGARFCSSFKEESEPDGEDEVRSPTGTDVPFNGEDVKNCNGPAGVVRIEVSSGTTGGIDNQSKLLESRRQEILEKEILDNLNETIGRFDNENENENDRTGETYVDEAESSAAGSGSYSTDSIQSTSPTSKPKSPGRAEDTCLPETFNSSWDSGVGVDVGTGNGWVRIHTGIESSLVYLTLDTTAKDVCRDMLLGEDLSLFMQVSARTRFITRTASRTIASTRFSGRVPDSKPEKRLRWN